MIRALKKEIELLKYKLNATIVCGVTNIINQIEAELSAYFTGKNLFFKTPIHLIGSPFQKKVWHELQKIPAGETRTYYEIAIRLHIPSKQRAVAKANGANQLALIVPCHRIINSNGSLVGYGGGIARKRWLLEHEKHY